MAGTVISGGFPGRVAQEVQPNPKCRGCLHYVDSAGRTGVCSIGLRPWLCGDTGDAADIGYAPIDAGAGAYLPDMSNHGAHAHEVETQFVSDLYGAGSTRPVQVQQVSLGEEHVHFVKSYVQRAEQLDHQGCRLHQGSGNSFGYGPYSNAPQICTCGGVDDVVVAKALAGRLSNRERLLVKAEQLVEFVHKHTNANHTIVKSDIPHGLQHGDMIAHSGGDIDFHHDDPKIAASHSQIARVHSMRARSDGSQHVTVQHPHSSGKWSKPQALTGYDSVRHPTHEDMAHHHKMLTKFYNARAKLKNQEG